MTTGKACTKCDEVKPLDAFSRSSRAKDGRKSDCKLCASKQDSARYQKSRERARANAVAWREANPEKAATYRTEYYQANRERMNAQSRAYGRANPHLGWEDGYRRRAVKFGFTPVVESFTRDELIEQWGDACYLCGSDWDQIDHVMEVHQGGHHTLENVKPCCADCNMRKTHQVRRATAQKERENMAYWTKTTTHGPDGEWARTPQFAFTPQETDLLSLAIESAALGAEGLVFTPSEGIRLSRIHAVLDAAADWAEASE